MEHLKPLGLCNQEEMPSYPAETLVEPFAQAAWDRYSDEELVERIRHGNPAVYEVLMRRYNQRIYRVVLSITRNDSEAEDVMQEAYVRAYQHLGEFEGKAKFSTWLTKIAVYEALSRVRRLTRTGSPKSFSDESLDVMDTVKSDERDPERQMYDQELKLVLQRAIQSLPDSYRSVFVLRVVEGLDVNETAAALEISAESVKTRLHRGRALLRKELERRAGIVAPQIFSFHLSRCDRVVRNALQKISASLTDL